MIFPQAVWIILNILNSNDDYNFIYGDIRNELIMDRLVSKCDVSFSCGCWSNLIINDPIRVMDTTSRGTEMLLKYVIDIKNCCCINI